MSAKSKLNELCQQRWQKTPIYNTKQVGGEPHNPTWQSECTLPDGNNNVFSCVHIGSRKQAEEKTAIVALESIFKVDKIMLKEEKKVEESLKASNKTSFLPYLPLLPTVFVDCDNIGFVDAAFCSKFPDVQFIFYISFHRNIPNIQNAAKICDNVTLCEAPHPGSDVCDVMILFDVFSHVQRAADKETDQAVAIIVSGDKLLYNAQLLLSPHVVYLGSQSALENALTLKQ